MAAPSYTTDLTTIATGDLNVDTGTWDESSDAGWDTGGAMVDDQNLYYNNTECVSAQMTKDSNGTGTTGPATIMYVHGTTWTIPTDGAVLLHHLWAAPPALNTLANGGVKTLLGNGFGDFSAWNCSGSDFKPAPKGGWTTYALNPAVGTADDTVGTGAASPYTTVGGAVGALAQARGNPHACNAIRYGRCIAQYTDGDLANGYATFLGFGAVDATSTNKWSLLDPVEGGYSAMGLMSIGLTGTSVDFRDANRNITFANTINVTSAFNRIEIHHVSSNVEWTNINITSLGTVSAGQLEVIDNAIFAIDTCVFTDMSTFIFQSNSELLDTTFRRCGLVTQGSAILEGCLFEEPTGIAMLVDDLDNITYCDFTSDGTGYAIELTSAHAGGSFSLIGCTFTGYGANLTTNAAIYNNSGGAVTIGVGTGTVPTYNNGTSATTTITGSVPVKIIVKDAAGVVISGALVGIYTNDDDTELVNQDTDINGEVTYAYTGSTPRIVRVWIRKASLGATKYINYSSNQTIAATTGLSLSVTMIVDPNNNADN